MQFFFIALIASNAEQWACWDGNAVLLRLSPESGLPGAHCEDRGLWLWFPVVLGPSGFDEFPTAGGTSGWYWLRVPVIPASSSARPWLNIAFVFFSAAMVLDCWTYDDYQHYPCSAVEMLSTINPKREGHLPHILCSADQLLPNSHATSCIVLHILWST